MSMCMYCHRVIEECCRCLSDDELIFLAYTWPFHMISFFATERKRIVAEHEAAIAQKSSSVIVATPITADGTKRKHRRTHGKISFSDLARTIADRWKEMNDTDRVPYSTEAAKDKARYDREMTIFKMKKDIEKKKAEQKRLEEIIAQQKRMKEIVAACKMDEATTELKQEVITIDDNAEVEPPAQCPPTNSNITHFPRTDSFGLFSLGNILEDEVGFGNDDLMASFNNSLNLDASALAELALTQPLSQTPGECPQQALPSHFPRPPSRQLLGSLDMLLEGTREDRGILEADTSDRITNEKAKKVGVSNIGEVSLPTPHVPLLHPAPATHSGTGGSGWRDDSAYSDEQLIQELLASIEADERHGIGGEGDGAIPSSLHGTRDLIGNFVRGSAA